MGKGINSSTLHSRTLYGNKWINRGDITNLDTFSEMPTIFVAKFDKKFKKTLRNTESRSVDRG